MIHIDTIIIGAGISGLYIGKQLLKKNKDFCIFEKMDYAGGRIYTKQYKNNYLELGASIFHSNQKRLMNLINELKLDSKIKKLDGVETLYIYNYKKINPVLIKNKLTQIENILKLESNKRDNDLLSLEQLSSKILKQNDYKFYQTYNKEWFEVKDFNCVTYFNSLDKYGEFYAMKNGLLQIVDKLKLKLKYNIIYNTPVTEVQLLSNNSFIINKLIHCNHLYLCTTLKGAKEINFLNMNIKPLYSIVKPVSTLRFYVVFKKDNIINHNIVSNAMFKWCIKINERVVMISYVDGQLAKKIHGLGEKRALDLILQDISKSLNKNIDKNDVEKVYFAFWNEAFSVINADVSIKDYYKILNSLPSSLKQTIIPLEYGIDQAWIESVLLKI